MRVPFFSSIDLPYRSFFRSFYTLQNLQTVKAVSVVYFIANLFLRIIGEATDWMRNTSEDMQKWREKLANSNGKIIN